jgi:hypothetical protein
MEIIYEQQFEKIKYLKNILDTLIMDPLHNEKEIELLQRELRINEERFILQTILNNNFTKIEIIMRYTLILNIKEFKLFYDIIKYHIMMTNEVNKNPYLNEMLNYKNYCLNMLKFLAKQLIIE